MVISELRGITASTISTVLVSAGVLAGTAVTWIVNRDVTPRLADVLLPLVACAALLFRRRHPVPVLVAVTAACGLYYPFAALDGPLFLAVLVALYTAADLGHLTAAITVAAVGLLMMGYGEVLGPNRHLDDSEFLLLAGWMVASVAIGGVTRNRHAYLEEARRRLAEAERTREEEALRRAVEERLRIARELHDVIGHNISLINVQAGAALHRIKERPEQAEPALAAIKETSKEALRELRATLGVLRQVDEESPVAPAPSLARVHELIERTGLTVRTELVGEARDLPAEVDLAAVRIVQEALTNVSRHSGGAAALVTIHYGEEDVTVQIDNGMSGDATAHDVEASAEKMSGGGFGLKGMRERATALGGSFEAGPRPGGGFRVLTRIPTQPASP
ncbi:sensor histidine kinase [Microtetraspora malaysiensis]|uniref:histidine kinase n=1 Tax=Microtetraspora malaysiensis TaxID=161358 RepID=A0ABW6SPV2_9ACTN